MKSKKPGAGKGKGATSKQGPNSFTFIPALGIHEDSLQFTREGWEKVKT